MPATTAPAAVPDAPWIRRMLALLVDWVICTLVVAAFVGPSAIPFATNTQDPNSTAWVTFAFLVESTVMTWLGGGSLGKLLTGLCVVPADGRLRRLHPAKIMLRQLLILLVIPPLVFRNDGRGLHDLAAGTSTVTFATMRSLMGPRGR